MKNRCRGDYQSPESGITLIALIITIIILVILAAVSINAAYNSGIVDYAVNGTQEYIEGAKAEESKIANAEEMFESAIRNANPAILGKVSVGKKASKNSTINGGAYSSSNPIIPKDYYPINQGDALWGNGTSAPTAAAVSAGLVITDEINGSGVSVGNEWVWVPVQKNAQGKAISNNGTSDVVIYQEENTGINMFANENHGTTLTNKYSTSGIITGSYGSRDLPSSYDFREPTILVGTNGTSFDNATSTVDSSKKWYQIAGFNSLTEMLEGLRDDYADMLESIEEYGGFYIGRYELSVEGVKKGKTVASGTISGTAYNWYKLYANCKALGVSNANVETRMIWGNLWDVTCNWIASEKDANNVSIHSISDSSTWGNFGNYNNSVDSSKQVTDSGTKVFDTGTSEYWKAKNIYDFAGNCEEFTQEANGPVYRVLRGGCYGSQSSLIAASSRDCFGPNVAYEIISSRPVLYINIT